MILDMYNAVFGNIFLNNVLEFLLLKKKKDFSARHGVAHLQYQPKTKNKKKNQNHGHHNPNTLGFGTWSQELQITLSYKENLKPT